MSLFSLDSSIDVLINNQANYDEVKTQLFGDCFLIIHARTANRFTANRNKGPGYKYYRSRNTAILEANFPHDTNKPTIQQFNKNKNLSEYINCREKQSSFLTGYQTHLFKSILTDVINIYSASSSMTLAADSSLELSLASSKQSRNCSSSSPSKSLL